MTSPDQWRHCPGKLNPADDAFRGLKPQKLIDQHCWWKGPEYLWESEENWPEAEIGEVSQNDPEVRDEVQAHSIKIENPDSGFDSEAPCSRDRPVYKMMTRYSLWLKLQRSIAWLVRFCHWLRNRKTSSCTEALTAEELREATLLVMRLVQAQSFAEELRDLKANKEVKSSSRLAKLKPVLADAVLHVGGRLEEAVVLSYDEKHPIILPKKHHDSRLIVRFCHGSLAHAGREQTLAQTRKMFWILGGRGFAKNIIRNCFKCRRLNERPMKKVMAPLPKERLQPYKPPFTFSGVDFFGPLMVKWGRGSAKRWGCLFTCLTTRAVFLELVPSLETDDFMMALRQFVSRRAPPRRSDWTEGLPYLPVYNAHFFFVKLTFKIAMRIIHGSHCLVTFSFAYHKQENQSLAVNGFYLL